MTTQIANPQSGQLTKVKGPEINDRDLINDVLSFEKYLSNGYNTGLNEMQNPKLHQAVSTILSDIHQCQWQAFNMMFEKGWYKMNAAPQEELSKTYTQFNNYKSQFPEF